MILSTRGFDDAIGVEDTRDENMDTHTGWVIQAQE